MNEMELYFWFQNLFIKISLILFGIYIFWVLIIPLYYFIKEEIKNKIKDYKEKKKKIFKNDIEITRQYFNKEEN